MLGIAPGARLNDNARLDHDLDLIKRSGAHAFRWYPGQANVEKVMGSGDYDWTEPDAVLGGAKRRELGVLVGVSARFDGHAYEPDRIDATASYAYALAKRYETLGIGLGFEGHNEAFFTKVDSNPTASRYTDCQAAIYQAIKSAAPTALVGTGGIIGSSSHLVDLYAAGCKPFFDFVCWHPYTRLGPHPCSPAESIQRQQGGFYSMRQARHTMVANHDGAKQIWVTEYGTNSGGPGGWGEAVQSSDLRDAVTRFRRHSWAGPFFAFTGWDSHDPAAKDAGDFMGMFRADDTEKLACATFRELAQVA